MKRIVAFTIILLLAIGNVSLFAFPSSDDFNLYTTNEDEIIDDSANEEDLMSAVPVGEGYLFMFVLATAYTLLKRKTC